jgi:putative phosphoribosyl transferase
MKRAAAIEAAEELVVVPAGEAQLEGNLVIPENAIGIIAFAHGSGSSRHSVRNRYVASTLNEGGLATLLFDLLTADEEAIDISTTRLRFDIALLAERLIYAVDWVLEEQATKNLPIGLFGSSTGAAAALIAAAQRPALVEAVVSRGGRPDLAGSALADVEAPSLLIVGGNDVPVIELNRQAYEQMDCEKALKIVPHATHLFEEPGALEEVSRLARSWFAKHLADVVA